MAAETARLEKQLDQLRKDMVMAGVGIDDLGHEDSAGDDLDQWILRFAAIVRQTRKENQVWQNLNYRIDLPSGIPLEELNDNEIARLYLIRSFQKVWLRAQFSDSSSKDGDEKDEKHLKR